ncbi:MAG: O-antigen ligase family protein [Planctomycetota bacterium]
MENSAPRRLALWIGLPVTAIAAGFFFLCAIHNSVTSFRLDRGWSQDIPIFGFAALGGLIVATLAGIVAKRPVANAGSIISIVVGMMTFAYFSGRVPEVPTVEKMAMPPNLKYWYLGATFLYSAAMAWIVPVRPIFGFLLASIVFATPAVRVLLRWAPEGFEVAPVGIALAAVAHSRTREPVPFVWPKLATPALVFLITIFFSSVFSSSQQIGWPAFGRTALQFCAFVAAVEWLRREADGGRKFVSFVAIVCTIVAACELFVFYEFGELVGWKNVTQVRLESFNIHPNLSAPFSMIGTVVCAGAFICLRGAARKLAAILALAVCALSLYLHKSGGATLGAAAGCGAIMVFWAASRFIKSKKFSGILGGGSLIILPAALLLASFVLPLFVAKLRGGGESGKLNIATRMEFWPAAQKAMFDHPVFGLGPKNVEAHAPYVEDSVEANIDWSNHPHNILLEIGETIGIPGLLAFIALLCAAGICFRSILENKENADAPLAIAGAGVVIAIVADGFVDHGFAEFAVVTDALWWGLAWIAIAAPRESQVKEVTSNVFAPLFTIGTTAALMLGAVLPLAASEIEQSIKWIHFWIANSSKYDTIRDVPGRKGHLELLLRMAPARSDIRLMYADILISSEPAKNIEAANREVERAVESSPYTADVLIRAGTFFANTVLVDFEKQTKRALELFQRATKLGNQNERATAHLGLARCHAALNQIDDAMNELSIALSMNPSFPITVFGFKPVAEGEDGMRDAVYWLGGNNKLSVASAIRRGMDKYTPLLEKDFAAAWGPMSRLAECYCNISRFDLAIAAYEEIEKKSPSARVNLPSALGQARILGGQFEAGLEDINRAIRNGGPHPYLLALRAKALDGLNRKSEALVEAEKFFNNPVDVVSQRKQVRDSLTRFAAAKQTASQYRDSSELYKRAAAFEDSNIEKIKLEVLGATAAVRGYRHAVNEDAARQELVKRIENHFDRACDVTGMMEWNDFDRQKLIDFGRDVGAAAGPFARDLFEHVRERIDKSQHPSAGAYFLLLGFGNAAIELLKVKNPEELEKVALVVNSVRRVAFSLSARIAGVTGM